MGFLRPTIDELADSASLKRRTGEATKMPVAIGKALAGKGITDKLDVKWLKPQIANELRRRAQAEKQRRKEAKALADRIGG